MINKFGDEIKVYDLGDIYRQLNEARVRHLRNVRDRFRKYREYGKSTGDSTLRAEQLCQLAQWKKRLSEMKGRK